jgi:hypothetical protein
MSNANSPDQPPLDNDGNPLGENSAPTGRIVMLLTLVIGVIAAVMFVVSAWLKG